MQSDSDIFNLDPSVDPSVDLSNDNGDGLEDYYAGSRKLNRRFKQLWPIRVTLEYNNQPCLSCMPLMLT